jgi:peptidoglycan/xylan/chitin deacetylase (PgdA/CDA1 family)
MSRHKRSDPNLISANDDFGWSSTLGRAALGLLSPGGTNNRLSILIYHRVLPEKDPLFPGEVNAFQFDRQLRLLQSFMNFVSLSDAVNGLQCGTLPPRAVCVTFDDGYADNAEVALPILRKLGIPATFFVATGFLNGGRMWNDSVIEMVRRAPGPVLDFRRVDLGYFEVGTIPQRQQAIATLISTLKYQPFEDRAVQIDRMRDLLPIDLPSNLMMTTAQVVQLRDGGMEIGGHTANHPILARLSPSHVRREIASGKELLEDILGEAVRFFAYPNGKPGQDYLSEHVGIVKDLGFEAAVSTSWGTMHGKLDLYQLPRFTPWDIDTYKFVLRIAKNLLERAETA